MSTIDFTVALPMQRTTKKESSLEWSSLWYKRIHSLPKIDALLL